MEKVTTVKLPTYFEDEGELNDSRFRKVKIYIAHTGENLNNSVFPKEVLEAMISSLANIPILGYIRETEDEEADFRGHERSITIGDDGVEIKFNTHAYGFVPADNNAHFEITGGKEWLVSDGYLWTRFGDAMNIFDEGNGSKGQSMEVANADGYKDDRGRMVFTSATFTGLCILGDDVPPAMIGSTISTVFSKASFKTMFEEMIAEFSAQKGELGMPAKKKAKDEATKPVESEAKEETKVEEKPSSEAPEKSEAKAEEKEATPASTEADKTEAPAAGDSEVEDHEEESCGTGKADDDKKKKNFADKSAMDKKEDDKAEGKKPEAEKEEEPKEDDESKDSEPEEPSEDDEEDNENDDKKKSEFTLALDAQKQKFMDAIYDKWFSNENVWPCSQQIYDDHGIVLNVDDGTFWDIQYSVNADDSIKVGEKTQVFEMFVTADEKAEIESSRAKIEGLQSQLDELTKFKKGVEMSAKKKALDEAREALSTDQVKSIQAKFEEMTPEEVEKEIAFAIYTTSKGSFKQKGGIKATNFKAKQDYGYGSANALFHN